MSLFRRRQGRHALGAPVVAMPAAPPVLRAPVVSPPWESLPYAVTALGDRGLPAVQRDAVQEAPAPMSTAPSPGAEVLFDLASSISGLIASGEAWAEPVLRQPERLGDARPAMTAEVDAAVARPPAALPRPRVSEPVPSVAQQVVPTVGPVPLATLLPAPIPAPVPTPLPDAVLTPATTGMPAIGPAAVTTSGRVCLGFRDGSTAQLDPDSDQAAALEQLAVLLSVRD